MRETLVYATTPLKFTGKLRLRGANADERGDSLSRRTRIMAVSVGHVSLSPPTRGSSLLNKHSLP